MKVGPRAQKPSRGNVSRLALIGVVLGLGLVAGCGRSGDSEGSSAQTTSSLVVTTAPPTSPTTEPTTTTTTRQLTYVIQAGDSLSVIAERFGITTKELADFNAIVDANSIKVNQEIAIPPLTVAPPTTAGSTPEETITSEG